MRAFSVGLFLLLAMTAPMTGRSAATSRESNRENIARSWEAHCTKCGKKVAWGSGTPSFKTGDKHKASIDGKVCGGIIVVSGR